MNESQISVRYAKALFQSASEKDQLDAVYEDMELLTDTCKLQEFQYMLVIPTLLPSQKAKIISSVLGKHLSALSMAMIDLVVKNKRELYLSSIARNLRDLFRKEKGIRAASLVTARAVDEATMNSIRELIASAYGSEVELVASVKEEVIGGFVLTIEDLQYDASVASSLRKIKNQLLQTSIENK